MEMVLAYEIGKHINSIHEWRRRHKTDKDWWFFEVLGSTLGNLSALLEQNNIAVKVAKQLKKYSERCINLTHFREKIGPSPWSGDQEGLIKSKMFTELYQEKTHLHEQIITNIPVWFDRIEEALFSIKTIKLYTNTQLNPDRLLKGAESFFQDDIWKKLSNLQKGDLNDGCRCLSLKLWTPSAMITVRAIESAVRYYYSKKTNITTKKNLGKILAELLIMKNTDKELIGYLKYIKKIRNQLQHPDVRFKQEEAEEIFQHALSIIRIIYS